MDEQRLSEIEQRVGAASPPPWGTYENVHGWHYTVPSEGGNTLGKNPRAAANAEFIAHAREDVPELIAEVRRLWRLIEESEDRERDRIGKHPDS